MQLHCGIEWLSLVAFSRIEDAATGAAIALVDIGFFLLQFDFLPCFWIVKYDFPQDISLIFNLHENQSIQINLRLSCEISWRRRSWLSGWMATGSTFRLFVVLLFLIKVFDWLVTHGTLQEKVLDFVFHSFDHEIAHLAKWHHFLIEFKSWNS